MINARADEVSRFHHEIRGLFEKYGMVDYFYGCVDYDQETSVAMRVGETGMSRSNVNRRYLVRGMLAECDQALGRTPPSITRFREGPDEA